MKRKLLLLTLLLVAAAGADVFRLGPGDVFDLSVYGELVNEDRGPSFSGRYRVDPDGNIQVHFMGTLRVEGLTLEETRRLINDSLSSYLINPDVTVSLVNASSRYVYVLGHIARQQRLSIGTRDTVLDVIARCGGELYDARLDGIKVIRGGLSNPEVITVDLLATIQEGDFTENISVQPGDIIYVPRTLLWEWNEILARVFPSLSLVSRSLDIVGDEVFDGTTD